MFKIRSIKKDITPDQIDYYLNKPFRIDGDGITYILHEKLDNDSLRIGIIEENGNKDYNPRYTNYNLNYIRDCIRSKSWIFV